MWPERAPQPESRPSFAAAFAPALTDPARATPEIVTGPNGKAAVRRYNVYRNNVTVSLIEALAAIYPAVRRVTGAEFFRAMARFHIQETPPTSPLLFQYGHDFPAFIDRYEHARPTPWLGDAARVERAWLDAYHAADADPLPASTLAAAPPDSLAGIRLEPHPATRLVRSRYAAVSIFAANRGSAPFGVIDASVSEDALVTRPDVDVSVRRLPPGGAVFLSALIAGEPLGNAAAEGLAETETFDIGAAIAGMLEAGAFTAFKTGDAS
ncbi:DNA-binding domain-containing protein [Methylocella sp.]|uniref:DNA-binding domain-containing protein n=1 Tax=Methylocella sp. TaxID=1978226 RepID=UPI003783E029